MCTYKVQKCDVFMSISLKSVRKLEVEKEDDCFDLEIGDCATIWIQGGDVIAAEIVEIKESELVITDEDSDESTIPFDAITDIEQG